MPFEYNIKKYEEHRFIVVLATGEINNKDIKSFCDFFNEQMGEDCLFKILFNISGARVSGLGVFKLLAQEMINFETKAQGKLLASAILVESGGIENSLKLLFSMCSPKTPTKIVTSLDDGCDFLNNY